jgi:hypothetical protein
MRMLTIVLAAAVLQVPGSAEAKKENKENKEDYYVVREGGGDQCKIVAGKFGDPPVGAIGSAPYAGKQYATARSKNFPNARAERRQRLKARNREKS